MDSCLMVEKCEHPWSLHVGGGDCFRKKMGCDTAKNRSETFILHVLSECFSASLIFQPLVVGPLVGCHLLVEGSRTQVLLRCNLHHSGYQVCRLFTAEGMVTL